MSCDAEDKRKKQEKSRERGRESIISKTDTKNCINLVEHKFEPASQFKYVNYSNQTRS